MNYNNTWALCFVFIAAMYFSNAYGLKRNEQRRQQLLAKVTVNKDKSVKTARRTFKSVEGYVGFNIVDSFTVGIFASILAALSYVSKSTALDFIGPIVVIVIYTAFNFYFYSKYKDK